MESRRAQTLSKAREAETLLASGKSMREVCRALQISKQTLYRWRARTRKSAEAERLDEVLDENRRLRRIVSDQALTIQALQDAHRKP